MFQWYLSFLVLLLHFFPCPGAFFFFVVPCFLDGSRLILRLFFFSIFFPPPGDIQGPSTSLLFDGKADLFMILFLS